MRQRRAFFLLPAVALGLGLTACGSDDSATESTEVAVETTTPTDGTTAADDEMTGGEMAGEDLAGDDMDGGNATVGDVTVSGVWVRQPAEGQTVSAAYGVIMNDGDTDITLVGGEASFAGNVEVHETTMGDDGTMQMQEVPEGFVVPAGGAFELKPGGPHMMFLDIDPTAIGASVEITMLFDDGTEVLVTAPVRALDMGAMDSGMDSDMTGTTMPG